MIGAKGSDQRGKDSSFYCDLSALDNEQRKRHRDLTRELLAKHLEIKELPDGYGMRFPHETLLFTRLSEWATLEHLCCPFLTLTLELHQGKQPVWLRISGDDGVKEFLRTELGI